jgi:hypothetical protein
VSHWEHPLVRENTMKINVNGKKVVFRSLKSGRRLKKEQSPPHKLYSNTHQQTNNITATTFISAL